MQSIKVFTFLLIIAVCQAHYQSSYMPQVSGFASIGNNKLPVGSIGITQPIYKSPNLDVHIHTSHVGRLDKLGSGNSLVGDLTFKF